MRNAASLLAGTGCSRVLGFARDVLFAYILGAGWVADIFLAAFRVPHFARRLLQEGTLALSFIPVFRREHDKAGLDKAYTFGRTALLELVLFFLALTFVCVACAYSLAELFLPGMHGDASLLDMAASLLRISLFYLPLAAGAAVGSGMLMALGRYKVTACSPIALNLGLLAAAVYVLCAGSSGYQAALFLCTGLLLGGALQCILHAYALRGQGFKLLAPLDLPSQANRAFLRALPPSMFGSAAYQLNVLIATVMASFLGEGAISSLYYAERLMELPTALIGVTLGTASMASFASLVIEEKRAEISLELQRVLGMVLFLGLPAAIGLVAFALPLVQMVYWRGAFNISAIALTGAALVCYAPALPAIAVSRVLLAALNAKGNTKPTVAAALASLVCMVICAAALMPWLDLAGIALAGSVAAWLNCALLLQALRRAGLHDPAIGFFPWRKLLMYFAMSLGMGAVAVLVNMAALRFALDNMLRLGLGAPLCVAVYFALAALARSPELEMLTSSIAGRGGKVSRNI